MDIGFARVSGTVAWKTIFVTMRAVYMLAMMPATRVMEKPRMRPVPKTKRMTAVMTVVRLPSKMARKARL